MAMEHGVQAILGLGREAHHLGSLRDQGAMAPDRLGWHPHARQQAGRVKTRQVEGRLLVRADLGAGDELDVRWVHERHRVDEG